MKMARFKLKTAQRSLLKLNQVLKIVKEKRTLIDVIRSRKKWIGHVLRGNGLLKEIIEGRIVGKRPRGRKRAMMLDDMKEGKELYAEMKESTSQGKLEDLSAQNLPEGRKPMMTMMISGSRYIHLRMTGPPFVST